jgi:phosphoglycerate dehydrogenase-like enzyme
MRRAVFNMRDERPVWAPPGSFADQLRNALGGDWQLDVVDETVSGRGDGTGVSQAGIDAIRGAEVYFGTGLPREILLSGLEVTGALRWIHSGAAGVRSLLHDELLSSDIILTNSAGIHAHPMAETVIAMMLHFTRGLDYAVRAQRDKSWAADVFEVADSGVVEITGATLGIIGYGGIGRAVAQRARALGMEVQAVRRHTGSDDFVRILSGDDAIRTLLESSDVVVLAVPSTPRTRSLIGAEQLDWMKHTAILINVARGEVLDETALHDALSRGRLRGAGLDVFATEPLRASSPLWTLPNVLVTPHVSATTSRYWEREGELILDNVKRYLAGEVLRNVVDVREGY